SWILQRAEDWEIDIISPDVTIPLMCDRTRHRVGYIIHLFAWSASNGREIGPEDVLGFNF
ncbi:MAG: hypothetical protein IID46_12375, partial [Planctomycetes bacterium]|nr:hypothetical protein [Planctomycetota bacterium]